MFFKRIFLTAIALISVGILGLSIVGFLRDGSFSVPFVEHGPFSSLTELPGSDGPILVIKIDDTTFAHPQVGLTEADLVYIEQVEGGLTRLAALYSSHYPDLVGPVRSARISDIDLFSQFGRIGLAFSGVQTAMRPVIEAANLYDLSANKFGPTFYSNDPTRIAPYAMMLKANDLLLEAKSRGEVPVSARDMGWKFGESSSEIVKVSGAHISWPASSYDITWSENQSTWLLTHSGNVDLDQNGNQLGVNTFVVQLVSITDSIFHDKVGGITPLSQTIGEGKCYIFRDGGYLPCIWKRESAESPTQYLDSMGEPLPFVKGQIWFALTSKEPEMKGLSK